MTDKEKEAIERFKHNASYLITSKETTKIILNLIQTQQAEIETKENEKQIHIKLEQQYKKEYLDTKEELEKKEEWINKLETKLMYALTPTKHELAKRTQEEFKRVIRENIDEDTYTIKRQLKENWDNL